MEGLRAAPALRRVAAAARETASQGGSLPDCTPQLCHDAPIDWRAHRVSACSPLRNVLSVATCEALRLRRPCGRKRKSGLERFEGVLQFSDFRQSLSACIAD